LYQYNLNLDILEDLVFLQNLDANIT